MEWLNDLLPDFLKPVVPVPYYPDWIDVLA